VSLKNRDYVVASIAVLSLVAGLGSAAFPQESRSKNGANYAAANFSPALPPDDVRFSWTRSLPITFQDPLIGTFGGTELRAIVTLRGRLYAANDYWQDSEVDNPALPGPQIYRLDSPDGQWQVEYELPTNTIRRRNVRQYQAFSNLAKVSFSKDKDGNAVAPAAELLVAGTFSRGRGIDVFVRSPSGRWLYDPIPPQSYLPRGAQIRPFAVHTDAVTGQQMIFAGSGDVIFSGKYNAHTQAIEWDAAADWVGPTPGKNNVQSHGGRITSLVECDGKLYAAGNAIYVRQDGPQPAWTPIYELTPGAEGKNWRGFSGLTCVPNGPSQQPALFAGFQGAAADIVRLDLSPGGAKGVVELNVADFLSRALGTEVDSAIVGYNDMTIYPTRAPACPDLLIGFSARTPNAGTTFGATRKYAGGGFLLRDCRGNYAVEWITDPVVRPVPYLVAVRAISLSPFSQDPPGTIYAGGFDAGNAPPPGVHNTAWLYKGIPVR
jgi:hypothetical protein